MSKVFIKKVESQLGKSLLEALDYVEWTRLVPRNARVFLKPNLTFPTPLDGVTTIPAFIEAVISVFKQCTPNITVGESDGGYRGWPAELSFKNHGLYEICEKYGVRLVNLSKELSEPVQLHLSKCDITLNLPSLLLHDIDVFVTLPVPKIHQVTTMSGAIKNQWGCIPDTMRLIQHPYFDEAILEINRLVGTRLALADGTYFLNRNGPMYGDPMHMDLILASDNIGAMDLSICKIMGLDIEKVHYLMHARKLGILPDWSEIEFNQDLNKFCTHDFYLRRSIRNRVVAYAFDRPWAIHLLWDSWFADIFHKILYAVAGNPIKKSIND